MISPGGRRVKRRTGLPMPTRRMTAIAFSKPLRTPRPGMRAPPPWPPPATL